MWAVCTKTIWEILWGLVLITTWLIPKVIIFIYLRNLFCSYFSKCVMVFKMCQLLIISQILWNRYCSYLHCMGMQSDRLINMLRFLVFSNGQGLGLGGLVLEYMLLTVVICYAKEMCPGPSQILSPQKIGMVIWWCLWVHCKGSIYW